MITAIIRKPTPTMETIYADDKKRHVETTLSIFHDNQRHLSRNYERSPFSRREWAKLIIKGVNSPSF
jgi:hypothetical protein